VRHPSVGHWIVLLAEFDNTLSVPTVLSAVTAKCHVFGVKLPTAYDVKPGLLTVTEVT
jgi:hypothetical protein